MGLVFFIPVFACILLAASGVVCFGLAEWALWQKRRRVRALAKVESAAPPLANPRAGKSSVVLFWKIFAGVGIAQIFLAVAGLWVTGLSLGWNRVPPPVWSDGQAPALEALIRKRCVRFVERGNTVGLSVALVTPTNAIVMGFGRQSLSGAPVKGDTLFELGSITKTFTALALAREIERGDLKLDQHVQELLPPGVKLAPDVREITLQNLTTHSSGFPRLPQNLGAWGNFKMFLFGSDPYGDYDEAQLLQAIQTVKPEYTPGSNSEYSNYGMMLLGWIIARQEHADFDSLIQKEVCQPLAMKETSARARPDLQSQTAQGYRSVIKIGPFLTALRSAPWFKSGNLGGAGSLRSSANDMLKYLKVNMRPAGVLENSLRATHRELYKTVNGYSYGMNWLRMQRRGFKDTIIWHNGGTGGYRSFLGFTEDGQIGVVVLSNSAHDVDALGMGLLRDVNAQ